MSNKLDDETKSKVLIAFLSQGWGKALHNTDSLLQVVQLVPDWQAKHQEALDNSLRVQHTQEKIDRLNKLCGEILENQVDIEELRLLLQSHLAWLLKPPN